METPIKAISSSIKFSSTRQQTETTFGTQATASPIMIMEEKGIGSMNDTLVRLTLEISELKKITAVQNVNINNLNDTNYKLNCPLSVIITCENGYYYAELVDFDIYGEGENPKESVRDLQDTLIVYYKSLVKNAKKLSLKQKLNYQILKKIISSEK